MTFKKIIKVKEFKPENISFSSSRANKHGGKAVYINYDYEDGTDPRPLRIQTGKMKAPFGVSGWDSGRADKTNKDPSETSNDTLELSFNMDTDSDIISKFQKLDEIIIDTAVKNSLDFFKKRYTKDNINLFYKSPIRFNFNDEGERDDKYPPRIKTKLLKDSNYNYITQVYSPELERIPFNIETHSDVLPKGSECITILECSGLWVVDGKFGVSWRPIQMRVYKNDMKFTEAEFLDDSDCEDDEKEEEIDTEKTDLFGDEVDDLEIATQEIEKTTISPKKSVKSRKRV
jgi:hypothetical protein